MSAISSASASSTASLIQSYATPLIAKQQQRVEAYNQITSDTIAQNTQRNIKESTDEPIVDQFGQIGLVKGLKLDISA